MGKINMNQEMLEILIGKYLDSEITPSEQQILEAELDKDPQAEELLRQFQDLHERSCEVVASELLGQGKTAEEVFTRAWKQHTKNPFRKIVKYGGFIRFACRFNTPKRAGPVKCRGAEYSQRSEFRDAKNAAASNRFHRRRDSQCGLV